jgi:hypothetical protein
MRPLVLCYSPDRRTAALGRELALMLGAEFALIRCERYEGIWGRAHILLDLVTNRAPPISLPDTPMSAARQVIVGGPVWFGRACGPVRSALAGHLRACYDLMLFLSYGPRDNPGTAEHAFAEARLMFGSPFQAYTAVLIANLEPSVIKSAAGRLARLFRTPSR